ncbi:IucA/IucC family protein [Streptacidiphilus fuscans]|uniref:Siderophore biosynthesis protein n=1 Tax=Streptacidiphilus fuscans TaxID=2789292 RepID=A0A931FIV7_9ACTN|nr:IucA/IucC family protein [Streptacidiphilus fuscans]MBF9073775.1 siderophore biosynthesis protein [Streptacidiphilus fuscans]
MTTVPAQQHPVSPANSPAESEDPLLHPDPAAVADAAAVENLLRCWAREQGVAVPAASEVLEVPLVDGLVLRAPVRYRSASGWHRFGPAELRPVSGESAGRPADAVTVAALLARTAAAQADVEATAVTAAASAVQAAVQVADLAGRVADSVRRVTGFVAARRAAAEPGTAATPFLRSEQALLLGHPFHPTPKSREGVGDAEGVAYAPELRGALRLHWFAVARELVAAAEGTAPSGCGDVRFGVDGIGRIMSGLRGDDAPQHPDGTVLLPVHPWQARELTNRPAVRALIDAGRVHDLGAAGGLWHPTSSVRTVYQPGTPWMLKLSLGLRITNSRRENLRKELLRGAEVHRLLESGLGAEWRAEHPGFDIVRDPAWIGVDLPGDAAATSADETASGFDTVLRQSPFTARDRVHCLAGLVAERPWAGGEASYLAEVVHRLATRSGRPAVTVAAEWFLRYLDAVALPLLWLDGRAGIALEAHQQNTLVVLDEDGWPVGGRYRDNQGYYFRDSHADALEGRLPGIGRASDTFVPDQVADERFAYYLGINHLLGLVGAFGSQQLADERLLLAALRGFLAGPGRATGSRLPERLLDSGTLRCKANLLTRLHGMDELVGPVETQSVYVDFANPLVAAPQGGGAKPPATPAPAFAMAGAEA